jgi:hypothetical protein
MSLLTAHKILITSAVALFVLYTVWELRNYTGGDTTALPRAMLSALGATGLALYLCWVWVRRPTESPHR